MRKLTLHPAAPGVDPRAPVLDYADCAAVGAEVEWRALPDGAELIVPPPPLAGQLVVVVLELFGSGVLMLLLVVGLLGCVPGNTIGLMVPGVVAILAVWWWVRIVRRLVRVARYGTMPTVLRTSPQWLTVTSPWLPRNRVYRFGRGSVNRIRITEEGYPGTIQFLRLHVVMRGDSLSSFRFPWRGGDSAAWIEWRLREAVVPRDQT
jgi:hypothetical protein